MNGPITTYNAGNKKPFAWSYSKLKNFEICPKRHFHYDIAKDVKEPESEQLKDGFFTHEKAAAYVARNEALPTQLLPLQPQFDRVKKIPGQCFVELKYAIRRDFTPAKYFDKDVWFRSVADVLKINGVVAYLGDWKTGKIVEDSQQLMLGAQCIFSHHPEIMAVRSEFIWLAEDAQTRQDFKRNEMPEHWANLMPRISLLEEANKTMTYPAKQNYLCRRWCAVTTCPYHGE